tara:strand:- start:2161 stop:2592 length:432 start_codon:yes stop_codon:yes gene_type:complete
MSENDVSSVSNVNEESVVNEEHISLNDLSSFRNIINIASRRGGFLADEFLDIGNIFNKLEVYLTKQVKLLENPNGEELKEEEKMSLNDLVLIKNIINLGSRRGAFNANEFSEIGVLVNKLNKFLEKNGLEKKEEVVNESQNVD